MRTMRGRALKIGLFGILFILRSHTCSAQGSAFTYQGRLNDSGQPASGYYNLTYSLFDSASGGSQVGSALTNLQTAVSNGIFEAVLDFGPGAFPGSSRWLELAVRTNGDVSFVTLSPRQQLTVTPYAITAENLNGTLPNSGLSGTYDNQVSFNNSSNQFVGTYSGNGGGLTNLNATALAGLAPSSFWQTMGNAGTFAGTNFVGTSDNQALELRVAGQRAFRLEPTTNTPNVLGGFLGNFIGSNIYGVTISGGGSAAGTNSLDAFALAFPPGTFVFPYFGTIGGGGGNRIVADAYCSIAGGEGNTIMGLGFYGGDNNCIGGGWGNYISSSAQSSIAGGINNFIGGAPDVGAGYSTIGGGAMNAIYGILDPLNSATIAGGYGNRIYDLSHSSTIGGGSGNSVGEGSHGGTVAGGLANAIGSGNAATVSGGSGNIAAGDNTVVAGGGNNRAQGQGATVSGGTGNLANGAAGTIPGGANNVATNYAFAAGQQAQAVHQGTFVWADSQNAIFASATNDQVNFRCQGGVRFTSGSADDNQTVSWIPGSASWSFSSDRNLKDRLAAVDVCSVLQKVQQLPLWEWSYRGYDQRHVGVMAQDFHDLFPLNENDKVLNDADLHGVTLAAIQGLNKKLEEELKTRDAEIKRLQETIVEMSRTLDTLAARNANP